MLCFDDYVQIIIYKKKNKANQTENKTQLS